MRSTAETDALRKRLESAFDRFKRIPPDEIELQADAAKHLCVLVSGYFETVVVELLEDYSKDKSSPEIRNYVSRELSYVQNIKTKKLLDIMGSFSVDWRKQLERFVVDELKDALDSVVDLRNKIAHGENVTVTYTRVKTYYEGVKQIVDFIAKLVD